MSDLPGMAISCQELVEIITDYLEGALDEPARSEIEAHLELCPHCAAYLEQMRTTVQVLGHIPTETLDDRTQRDLLTAFRSYRRPPDGG